MRSRYQVNVVVTAEGRRRLTTFSSYNVFRDTTKIACDRYIPGDPLGETAEQCGRDRAIADARRRGSDEPDIKVTFTRKHEVPAETPTQPMAPVRPDDRDQDR